MAIPLGSILKAKLPSAKRGPEEWDYRVRDDGKGPFIEFWNEVVLGPQPDNATLAQWAAAYKPSIPPTKDERLAKFLEREGLTLADLKAALAK